MQRHKHGELSAVGQRENEQRMISTICLRFVYEKDPVDEGGTNLLCTRQFKPNKRRELHQEGGILVLWLSLFSSWILDR